MKRASSTSIRTFLGCPRKAVFAYSEGFEVETNDGLAVTPIQFEASLPMAKGTIIHAILEQRFAGLDDSEEAVRAMEGNYEDPREALDAYPDEPIWDVAVETADVVGDPREYIEDYFGQRIVAFEIEFDLEEHGLYFEAGPAAGGYIDLLLTLEDGTRVVWDWKTRSRLDYAPRTESDFRGDPQLCYYGAAMAKYLYETGQPVDEIVVAHGNLLRADKPGGPKETVAHARLETWYLEKVWEYLEGVAEEMTEAMKKHPAEAPRSTSQCYKYGPCPHLQYCAGGGKKIESIFSWAKNTNLDHLVENE